MWIYSREETMQEIVQISWRLALIGFMTTFMFLVLWITLLLIIGAVNSAIRERIEKNNG